MDSQDKLKKEYADYCGTVEEESLRMNFLFQKVADLNVMVEKLSEKAGIKPDVTQAKGKFLGITWQKR